jgi:hypothetical protein
MALVAAAIVIVEVSVAVLNKAEFVGVNVPVMVTLPAATTVKVFPETVRNAGLLDAYDQVPAISTAGVTELFLAVGLVTVNGAVPTLIEVGTFPIVPRVGVVKTGEVARTVTLGEFGDAALKPAALWART